MTERQRFTMLVRLARSRRMAAAAALLLTLLQSGPAGAQAPPSKQSEERAPEAAAKQFAVPNFRHVDASQPEPDLNSISSVRFLADDNFPPFSYRDAQGGLTGFNVALADAVCLELRLKCEFIVKPWEEVESALARNEGDAVLSGVRINEANLERFDFTRPYARTLARFAVRIQNSELKVDPRSLAGKRLGVLAGTAHEALLMDRFPRSTIRPFGEEAAAREALRTGSIDALFGDGFRLMFWLASGDSRGCCRFAPGAYVDPPTVSVPMAIAVRRGERPLRDVLDYGLDRLQTSGTFASIYRRFFPMSAW